MDTYVDNVLRERRDDAIRVYTRWDASGAQVEQRPYTASENARADEDAAERAAESNRLSLQTRASNALANNAAFLGAASPTNAQVVAQVKALTRQNNALIRLTLNLLDDVSDS